MTFPWQRSIRARLATAITVSLAVILSAATVVSYITVRNMLFLKVDNLLESKFQIMRNLLDKNPNAAAAAERFYAESVPIDQTVYLQILTRENGVLFQSPSLGRQRLPNFLYHGIATMRLEREDARYLTYASDWYYLTIAVPVGDIESSLSALRLTFSIAVPLALLASLLIGYAIAKRSLRPIDSASAAARRITSQNLRERLAAPNYNDEVGRLVRTLNEMIERLEKSFASISEFTTNAAHELRTPLTILRGELEVEMRKKSITPEHRKMAESNLEEANRLSRIVENLFTLSRADSKGLALTLREVSLRDLLEKTRGRAAMIAAAKSIAVEGRIEDDCTVIGDGEMLAQVILNLVDNAVKYSPEHSVITLELAHDTNNAVVSIIDSGMGVADAHKEKIFERFYRADEARTRSEGGAGLGLSIARSIVAAHSGTISVESVPGKGSRFIVTLPVAVIE